MYWTLAGLLIGQIAALVRTPERAPAWFPYARAFLEFFLGGFAVAVVAGPSPLSQVLVATAVVAGRQWPALNRSLTTKALLIAAGAVSAMTPLALPLWAFLWALGFVVSGYRAAGSVVATFFLPFGIGVMAGWPFALMVAPACVLVLQRSRPEVRRLLLGAEPKYHWKSGG